MEALQAIPDIGPVLAANIAAFFRQDHNLEIIHRLRQVGVHWQEFEAVSLGRVCKLTMDPRHSSIRLFRKAASELLCKHALVMKRMGMRGAFWFMEKPLLQLRTVSL